MSNPVASRFAPSPTGALHLGNLRTALYAWLVARQAGGRFVLRIEDTDRERSSEARIAELVDDLHWLGLDWDGGPGRDDGSGPYRQSERADRHAAAFARLEAAGQAYPCFCTDAELEAERQRALREKRAPRYSGRCAGLDADGRAARLAEGRHPSLRFRLPPGQRLQWTDLVRGPQSFRSDDLGDFIIRRADGSASFLSSNAIDDAEMGITVVLRGEDHVANTPRQQALIEALGYKAPQYGHLPLLVGPDHAPLSKRDGALSVRGLRERGYLPGAVANLLLRLGHSGATDGYHALADMPAQFQVTALGHAPAQVDEHQLNHWQHEALVRAADETLLPWVAGQVPAGREAATVAALRRNVLLIEDAVMWCTRLYGALPAPSVAEAAVIAGAGTAFWDALLAAADQGYDALIEAGKASGAKGKGLFQPLRLALTGTLEGPELRPVSALMEPATLRDRLRAARALAAAVS
jgi:glutamyl-tRNA synthetase